MKESTIIRNHHELESNLETPNQVTSRPIKESTLSLIFLLMSKMSVRSFQFDGWLHKMTPISKLKHVQF